MHPTAESDAAVCIIPRSQAPRCASHCGVKLRGVHHTAESSSAMCITPRSQNAHLGVKIKIFGSLWMLLKGQSGEILLGVNRVSHFRLYIFFALKRNEAKQKPFRFLFASFCETKTIIFRFVSLPFASIFSLRFASLFQFLL